MAARGKPEMKIWGKPDKGERKMGENFIKKNRLKGLKNCIFSGYKLKKKVRGSSPPAAASYIWGKNKSQRWERGRNAQYITLYIYGKRAQLS